MGLFDRMEGKLERAVNGVFAKAFRAEVQPVEIASAIRRAMDDRAASSGRSRSVVPNVFTIELSETDFERLTDHGAELENELIAAAEEHADSQHYQPGGPIDILFDEDVDLETGVFRIRPSTAKRPRATGTTGQHQPVRRPSRRQDDDGYAGESPAAAAAPPVAAPAPAARPPREPGRPRHEPDDDALGETAAYQPTKPPARKRRTNPADRPWLDVDGERYPLMGAITVLGRDDIADIILDDPGISRRHSEIRVTQDGPHTVATIRDLGSTNGTFVGGERITTTHLEDGDRITVGRTSVTYRAGRK
ncbi:MULTISPECIES: FhaA domain-containing protein [unclassified Knoellia]|uniref:FhaA domain-containing protein n=1 Tax=Knoellia altitudinis TaxID=3404795 RepID=UPI00361E41C4